MTSREICGTHSVHTYKTASSGKQSAAAQNSVMQYSIAHSEALQSTIAHAPRHSIAYPCRAIRPSKRAVGRNLSAVLLLGPSVIPCGARHATTRHMMPKISLLNIMWFNSSSNTTHLQDPRTAHATRNATSVHCARRGIFWE